VACLVNGSAQAAVLVPPDYRAQCDISMLNKGTHSLAVRIIDQLGVEGESDPQTVTVRVEIPPTPTLTPTLTPTPAPTPMPTPAPTPEPTRWENFTDEYGILVALILAIGALILVVYALVRRPKVGEFVTTGVTNLAHMVREATEPFFPNRGARGSQPQAKAYLVVLEGNTARSGNIDLVGENVRFGRDAALVTVTFPDRSVSRLHARISETEDGLFYIYDEGSTSGTYVNYEQVGMVGHLLQHDDKIHFGRVLLQFKMREEQGPARPTARDLDHDALVDEVKTLPAIPVGVQSSQDLEEQREMAEVSKTTQKVRSQDLDQDQAGSPEGQAEPRGAGDANDFPPTEPMSAGSAPDEFPNTLPIDSKTATSHPESTGEG
jgi:pSer/pThr/pTyr-binding forkhead associated (FHA) protein